MGLAAAGLWENLAAWGAVAVGRGRPELGCGDKARGPSFSEPQLLPFQKTEAWGMVFWGNFFFLVWKTNSPSRDSDNVAISLCLVFSFFCHIVIEFTNLLNLKIYIVKHLVFSHSTTYLSVVLDTCVGCVTLPPTVGSAKPKTETVC